MITEMLSSSLSHGCVRIKDDLHDAVSHSGHYISEQIGKLLRTDAAISLHLFACRVCGTNLPLKERKTATGHSKEHNTSQQLFLHIHAH